MTFAVSPVPTFSWQRTVVALVLIELALLVCYFDTASAMVGIWWRSETFNHAFLVPPISLWLIWERRFILARLVPKPMPWLALPFTGIAFAWLLGDLAAVNAVTQFAFVAMLVIVVPMTIGLAATRQIAFPLAFLFFAVPFGEFVMPTLMDWTANFTVIGLRASGIPVYQEGLHFVIPSGRWSVVEACSGVRYLIASIVVGTLYAYLNYTSFKRRLIFVGVAILVPLAANWVRAYLIVMLGHHSGNELATGADHLIYGWVFFGLVILIMFAIGLRWREAELVLPPLADTELAILQHAHPTFPGVIIGLTVILALLPKLALFAIESGVPLSAPILNRAPLVAAGWQQGDAPLSGWQPAYANPSATLDISLSRDDQRVGVFIAYYRQQHYDRKLISSSNALANSGDKAWTQSAQGVRQVELGNQPIVLRTAVLRHLMSDSQRYVVWHAYWIDGRWVVSDAKGKLWLAWHKLTGRGDDSAAVFLYAPEAIAEASLTAYLAEAGEGINRLLSDTRAQY